MTESATPPDLCPNPAVLIGAGGALALASAAFLPWSVAIASSVLGILMIAGAEVDARTYLLPDVVTLGATLAGIFAAPFIEPLDAWSDPWLAGASAVARALGCAAVLASLRAGYAQMRHQEGIGLGDVKLAAAVGAWLPLDAIPLCFALAATRGACQCANRTVAWPHRRACNEVAIRRVSVHHSGWCSMQVRCPTDHKSSTALQSVQQIPSQCTSTCHNVSGSTVTNSNRM